MVDKMTPLKKGEMTSRYDVTTEVKDDVTTEVKDDVTVA